MPPSWQGRHYPTNFGRSYSMKKIKWDAISEFFIILFLVLVVVFMFLGVR